MSVLQASVAVWNHLFCARILLFPGCKACPLQFQLHLVMQTRPGTPKSWTLKHCCNDPADQPPNYTTFVKTADLIDVRHQDAVCNETRPIFTGGMLLHRGWRQHGLKELAQQIKTGMWLVLFVWHTASCCIHATSASDLHDPI